MPERTRVESLHRKVSLHVSIFPAFYLIQVQQIPIAERYERMERFIRTWCDASMPGPKPFFEAYASYHLLA